MRRTRCRSVFIRHPALRTNVSGTVKDLAHVKNLTQVLTKIKEFAVNDCRSGDNLGINSDNTGGYSATAAPSPNHWKLNMIIYGLKNCDTCRKALKSLPDARLHDVRANPPDSATLQRFLDAFPDTLINRRSTTWRNLSMQGRAATPLALLQAHPALMKRPLIDAGGSLYLGWGADVQTALKAAVTDT